MTDFAPFLTYLRGLYGVRLAPNTEYLPVSLL